MKLLLLTPLVAICLAILPSTTLAYPPCGVIYDSSNPNCLVQQLNKFLGILGSNAPLDGTPTTNMGPLSAPLVSQVPADSYTNHFYMYFAGAAYCQNTLTNLSCPWCGNITTNGYTFNALIQNSSYDTRAFIAINTVKKEIVISFRGSINAPNILLNTNLVKVKVDDTSGIRVHAGFKTQMDSLYPQVLGNLSALLGNYSDFSVVITGHSLGGAEAALFAFRLNYENTFPGTTLSLFTYGSPRVGNVVWADYMNGLNMVITRTVAYADVIPHISAPAGIGYYHHQTEYWIYNIASYAARYCNLTLYEDPACSDSLGPLYNVLDHLIYFDVNIVSCIEQDPLSFATQAVLDLNEFLPAIIFKLFPQLDITGLPLDLLLRELQLFLAG